MSRRFSFNIKWLASKDDPLFLAWYILQVTCNHCSLSAKAFLLVPSQEKKLHSKWFVLFRHVLAVLHFNENLHRQPKKTKNGTPYYSVTYPKFKSGDEVVRTVSSAPSYCKFSMYALVLLTYTSNHLSFFQTMLMKSKMSWFLVVRNPWTTYLRSIRKKSQKP